jgi:hypothetical protein
MKVDPLSHISCFKDSPEIEIRPKTYEDSNMNIKNSKKTTSGPASVGESSAYFNVFDDK